MKIESGKWKLEEVMRYEEWQAGLPADITGDPLWKLEVYRLALFAGDIAWQDGSSLSKHRLMRDLADQLYRSATSVSANIAEGFSRSTGKDRARFLEYALGSAREARDWYYKAHHTLKEDVVKHRIGLLTQVIKILSVLTPRQRQKGIREEQGPYLERTEPSEPLLAAEIPFS